jgi:hypothetical protein
MELANVSQQHLTRRAVANVPEGRHDRSLARSAWESGHTKRAVPEGRYDSRQVCAPILFDDTSGISCARSYRSLRDGSFEGRFSRHFVPGYDLIVPPGHFATGSASSVQTCHLIVLVLVVVLGCRLRRQARIEETKPLPGDSPGSDHRKRPTTRTTATTIRIPIHLGWGSLSSPAGAQSRDIWHPFRNRL